MHSPFHNSPFKQYFSHESVNMHSCDTRIILLLYVVSNWICIHQIYRESTARLWKNIDFTVRCWADTNAMVNIGLHCINLDEIAFWITCHHKVNNDITLKRISRLVKRLCNLSTIGMIYRNMICFNKSYFTSVFKNSENPIYLILS